MSGIIRLMFELLKTIWKPIEKGLRFVGKVQSTILLSIFYLVILMPVAIVYQIIKLLRPEQKLSTYWKKREDTEETEETLLRQF